MNMLILLFPQLTALLLCIVSSFLSNLIVNRLAEPMIKTFPTNGQDDRHRQDASTLIRYGIDIVATIQNTLLAIAGLVTLSITFSGQIVIPIIWIISIMLFAWIIYLILEPHPNIWVKICFKWQENIPGINKLSRGSLVSVLANIIILCTAVIASQMNEFPDTQNIERSSTVLSN